MDHHYAYRSGVIAIAVLLVSNAVFAYPSAVVFIPSGKVLTFGQLKASSYVPLNFHPRLIPGTSGIGFGAGLLPTASYAKDFDFEGLEAGLDVVNGAIHRDGTKYAKLVFNAKVGLLKEAVYWPATALGLMSFAPFQQTESLNHVYLSLTKTFQISGNSIGTLTLGAGYAAGAKLNTYRGSPQLGHTHNTLFVGYASPEWQNFSLYIDSVTGTSDMSSTNIALGYSASSSAFLMIGTYFTNNRTVPKAEIYDGVFASFTVKFDPWAPKT
jgi:hypothetical protein